MTAPVSVAPPPVQSTAFDLLPPQPDYPRLCHEFLLRAQPADDMIQQMMAAFSMMVPPGTPEGKIMGKASVVVIGHHARALGIAARQAGWLTLGSALPGDWLKTAIQNRHDDLTLYRADLRAKLLLGFLRGAYATQFVPEGLRSQEAVHYMHTAKRPYLSQLIAEAL